MSLAPPDLVLVRYGELALKGGNRRNFERQLARNIKDVVRPIASSVVRREHGRLVVVPARRVEQVARRVSEVFGVKSASLAWSVEANAEAITQLSRELLNDALSDVPESRTVTFRVRVKRADKNFPVQSNALERQVADAILPGPERVTVKLKDPELELGIDIRQEGTYIFLARLRGPGGLPVGTQGRALCLLSGGIDSPVAAWLTMRRGCQLGFVSFHSYPYIGEASKKKVADLARRLGRWQRRAALYVVPFTEIQVAIRDAAPESYRTVLYRRMMQRIASELAEQQGYQALVTGECLGQVASQTLENIACIGAAADLPVLRPLLGHDKEDTIAIAREIGTFEISCIPQPDCCTVFQPSRPIIKGRIDECERAEALMDVGGLVRRAIDGIETIALEGE
ncbi:MAG: tRNA 4-thiouridine(8) synthase ThiI [bacterium]|nr:tRNA 4-thiouridine(8) synthase ThiI [bacterium]